MSDHVREVGRMAMTGALSTRRAACTCRSARCAAPGASSATIQRFKGCPALAAWQQQLDRRRRPAQGIDPMIRGELRSPLPPREGRWPGALQITAPRLALATFATAAEVQTSGEVHYLDMAGGDLSRPEQRRSRAARA